MAATVTSTSSTTAVPSATSAVSAPSAATDLATDRPHCWMLRVLAPLTKLPIRLSQISAYTSPITTALRVATPSSRKSALYAAPATITPSVKPSARPSLVPYRINPPSRVGRAENSQQVRIATVSLVVMIRQRGSGLASR